MPNKRLDLLTAQRAHMTRSQSLACDAVLVVHLCVHRHRSIIIMACACDIINRIVWLLDIPMGIMDVIIRHSWIAINVIECERMFNNSMWCVGTKCNDLRGRCWLPFFVRTSQHSPVGWDNNSNDVWKSSHYTAAHLRGIYLRRSSQYLISCSMFRSDALWV